jgi:hypothetical protein
MTEKDTADISLKTWKLRKKNECRNRLHGIGSKKKILVDHAEDRIHNGGIRPPAYSLNSRE